MNTTDEVTGRTSIVLLQPDGGSVPMRVSLRWRIDDPYVVRMVFRASRTDRPEVGWDLSRELLAEGLAHDAGIGDVRITPEKGTDVLRLRLSGPTGTVTFLQDGRMLADFLDTTFDLVPLGSEVATLDFEAEVCALLDAAS
jgi:hypothetical protein